MEDNRETEQNGEDYSWETSSVDSADSNYLLDLADETEYEVILPKTNYHSPYYVNVPTPSNSTVGVGAKGAGSRGEVNDLYEESTDYYVREFPTDILSDRFHKWRKVLKGLVGYLKEVAYAQEQFARLNYQLKNAVKFSFLSDLDETTNKIVDPLVREGPQKGPQTVAGVKKSAQNSETSTAAGSMYGSTLDFGPDLMFEENDSSAASGFMKFGSGSVQDIQVILKKYHLSLSNQQIKASKDIVQNTIPKLEELRKDLSQKIKEIKELNGDFKTNIQEHVALTGQLLHKYIASVNFLNDNSSKSDFIKLKGDRRLKPKHDPYLLKLQLDLQLKRQLLEDNYLQEAYINLQSSGMELEKIVYSEVQKTLQRYSALIDVQARLSINNLCQELQRGMLSKPPCIEWDHFVTHHPKCLIPWKSTEPIPQPRKLSDVRYPKMKSPLAKCIRAGYLMKKSKYLKQYHRGYFLLTSNYLHEFKSSNFFKLSDEVTEKDDHAIVPSSGNKKRSLSPIMSIPLNEAILQVLEDKFIICANSAIMFDMEESEHVPSDMKKHSKSTTSISKFWKAGLKQGKNSPSSLKKASTTEDASKLNNVHFKKPSDLDPKEFKKWENNLRDLSSFNDTVDRAHYIEDKILKAHSRVASGSNVLQGIKSQSLPSKVVEAPQKPQFINISPAVTPPNIGSRVNTPAIDDNGNLIFAADRLRSSANVQGNYALPTSPLHSPPEFSPQLVLSPDDISSLSKQPGLGYVITSNGITPVQRPSPGRVKTPGSISMVSGNIPVVQSGVNTSTSDASRESSGGYFAIPLNHGSKGSTPGAESNSPPALVPKIRVHDSDDGKRSPMLTNYATEASLSRNAGGNLKKASSCTSVPSVGSQPSPRIISPVFSNHAHSSSTNSLQTSKSQQTQPVRRHKKTVSFNSLNSLMFSKKNPTPSSSQYLSDTKINEDENSSGININESLYS